MFFFTQLLITDYVPGTACPSSVLLLMSKSIPFHLEAPYSIQTRGLRSQFHFNHLEEIHQECMLENSACSLKQQFVAHRIVFMRPVCWKLAFIASAVDNSHRHEMSTIYLNVQVRRHTAGSLLTMDLFITGAIFFFF